MSKIHYILSISFNRSLKRKYIIKEKNILLEYEQNLRYGTLFQELNLILIR